METAPGTTFARTSSGMPAPPLRPKAGGFVQNMVSGINRLEQRATGNRRKKFEAKQLPPGQDIFHGYEFPQAPATATKTAGRKPYNWTPKRSRELIKLIIHSDFKFDDISTAMKDENGEGPSETTCRNHWHEIFGYSPDMARLKYGKGRERRYREHVEAFDAHRKKVKTLEASTVAAELKHSDLRAARSSKASSSMGHSRTSSIYADSGVQVDDDGVVIRQHSEDVVNAAADQSSTPDMFVTPAHPTETVGNSASSFDGYGLRPGLSTVQEDSETAEHTTRPSTPNLAPTEISPDDVPDALADRRASKIPTRTVAHIEEKEDLPSGFITWFRKISLGSTTESRHPSTASYASRTSLRFSRSVRNSVATSISMGYHQELVPKDAICKYLGNTSSLVEPSVGYVEELIQRGADVNAKNARGETPLHFAVGRGAIVICTILLQAGANAEAKSYSGESIWDFGRRISKNTLNPSATYDKTEQLLRTMVAARIEFLRATVRFNPNMIVEEPDRSKRRRNSDQNANAWSRSGAASSASRKKSKVHSPAATTPTPRSVRSPSTARPTPEPTFVPIDNRGSSNEATPQPRLNHTAGPNQWHQRLSTVDLTNTLQHQQTETSYVADQTAYPIYGGVQSDPPFEPEDVDPMYTAFMQGQEFLVDYDTNMPSLFPEDTATWHPAPDMTYMTSNLNNVQQQYGQSRLPEQQEYGQPSPPVQQQPGQSNSTIQQTYAQPSPPIEVPQFTHTNHPALQHYSIPNPPCPDGTVSPSLLSMAASPSHLSVNASPGQYFSDYGAHSERGNSDASNIDPVVVPATYTLGTEQSNIYRAQEYTEYPMASQYLAPDHAWQPFQQQ